MGEMIFCLGQHHGGSKYSKPHKNIDAMNALQLIHPPQECHFNSLTAFPISPFSIHHDLAINPDAGTLLG